MAKERVVLARRIYERIEEQLKNPPPTPVAVAADTDLVYPRLEQLAVWSRRLMEAEQDFDGADAARLAAQEAHLKRLRAWEDIYRELLRGEASGASQLSLDKLSYQRLEAEYELTKRKIGN